MVAPFSKFYGKIWVGFCLKDTHSENTPSNKIEVLTKSMNMYIWSIGILNQLFIRDSCIQIKFSKNVVVSGKSIFCDKPILYTSFSLS